MALIFPHRKLTSLNLGIQSIITEIKEAFFASFSKKKQHEKLNFSNSDF